jgi:ribosome biogenesis GTPase
MPKQDSAKQKPIRKTKTSNKRTLLKKEGQVPKEAEYGRLIANVGTTNLVRAKSGAIIECYLGGTVITPHAESNIVAVGDWVWYLEDDYSEADGEGEARARILKVQERKTKFSRKHAHFNTREQVLASNLDNVMIFSATMDPDYNKKLIDRYLVACEIGEVNPMICINKIDLLDEDLVMEDLAAYDDLGYEVYMLSAETGDGIDEILDKIQGEITLLSGPSGAGKSSFLNTVLGGDYQDVGEVSERSGKGMHTTSSSRLFDLGEDTYLIDSPGIRELAVWGIEEGELQLYFHDFDEYKEHCKFATCSHVHEPGCAVIAAVESEDIDPERYASYLSFLDTLG